MWKKLTDLLFEEDDVTEEEGLEEVEVQKPIKTNKPVKVVEPIEVKQTKVEETIIKEEIKEPVEEKPKSLGIVIDELQEIKPQSSEPIRPQVRTVESSRIVKEPIKTVQRPRVVPNSKAEGKFNYEFTPVISPIFGISEKDVDAVIPTNPNKKKAVIESKIGTVISPMYGMDRDNEPDSIFGKISPKVSTQDEKEAEDELMNFSLDDILAKRDQADSLDKTKFFKTDELEELDRTTVFSNHNMSLFDDENE